MSTLPRLLVEALLIGASGLGLGLLGNQLNPAGLRVERDYFPPAAPVAAEAAAPATAPATATPSAANVEAQVLARLAARGVAAIRFDEAKALYEDPLYVAGGVLFVDARNDSDYAAGHVPLALQFDHYHAERYLDAVLLAAPGTTRIVVYCSGGACEDSEFAAATLQSFLPDPSVLCVYLGGIEEWKARGMPVESGARGSGQITGGAP
jgi:rhodanese-related sulfurtransferase